MIRRLPDQNQADAVVIRQLPDQNQAEAVVIRMPVREKSTRYSNGNLKIFFKLILTLL